jgi:hypothetical protein
LDGNVKGTAFIRTNQALIEQMHKNWRTLQHSSPEG